MHTTFQFEHMWSSSGNGGGGGGGDSINSGGNRVVGVVVVVVVAVWWCHFCGRHRHIVVILNITTAAAVAVFRMGSDTPPWHCMGKWAYCTNPHAHEALVKCDRGNPEYREKMCLNATLATINPT